MRAALESAGYSVFWDQSTPPGKDWDSWIRDQLTGAKLVIALWTRTSVASPNVRHEAIIAREAGKLLPVMVDELAPTDFPMGLFMVQALLIGRTAREFRAAEGIFLAEVGARLAGTGGGQASPVRKPRRSRRRLFLIAAAAALLLAAPLLIFWPQLSAWLNPGAPPVERGHLQRSIAGERLARQTVARKAETMISGAPAMLGSTWAWGAGQLIAGAPAESRDLAERFFAYLRSVENPQCHCYYSDSIPHTIANAWVILASARLRHPIPAGLLETMLDAQSPEGWWTISLNAVRANENAAVHATALTAIALAEARRAGIVPSALGGRVGGALRRAAAWLDRGPAAGSEWSDYPNNDRREARLVFSAYAAVAVHLAGDGETSNAAAAFLRAVRVLPPANEQFASGAYIQLTGGGRFFDDYRHPASPWIGAAAVLAWPQADGNQRRALRDVIRAWLDVDLTDENLLRQDWTTAETLFLRALAFRELDATLPR